MSNTKNAGTMKEFFCDGKEQLSFGRLAAALCLIGMFLIVAAVIFLQLTDKIEFLKQIIQQLMNGAMGFYSGSKLQEAVTSFAPKPPVPPPPPPPPAQ